MKAQAPSFGLGLLTMSQLCAWLQVEVPWVVRQVKNGVILATHPGKNGRWSFDPQEVLKRVKASHRPEDGCWVCGGEADLVQEGRLLVRECRRKKCQALRIVKRITVQTTLP